MWHKVKDLSADQRFAIESLLGRRLPDDEGLNIRPSRVLKEEPAGEERSAAYRQYLDHLGTLAGRAGRCARCRYGRGVPPMPGIVIVMIFPR
jgi:hypothetical protein